MRRGLISVGGYDVHDPHANPAADSFSLSFTTCDGAAHSPALPEGVRFIVDMVRKYGSDVTVVATGPLTDVDAALTAAPEIAKQTAIGDDGRNAHAGRQLLGHDRRNEYHPGSGGCRPCIPFRRGRDHGRLGRDAPVPAGFRRDYAVAPGSIAIA